MKNTGMFAFLNDAGNYEQRMVGRDFVDGTIISTAFTSDEGYETAIIDGEGVHPVERYPYLEAAREGHQKWIEKLPYLYQITKLGVFSGLVPDEQITLIKTLTSDDV